MTIVVGTPGELNISNSLVEGFFAAHWTRPIALAEPSFSRWQFAMAPSAKGLNQSIVAYDSEKRKVAGVMGLTPRPFYLAEVERSAAELTTWIVAEDYRRSGAGAKILSAIMSRYDVLIGMGISSMALPIYLRSGFRYLRAIPRFVRVLNVECAARFGNITPVGRKLIRFSQPIAPTYSLSDQPARDIFERMKVRLNLFSRDVDHLKWRYETHPFFAYKTFTIASCGGEAFVAVRMESAVPGLRVLHVIDCFGDEAAMPGAVSFLEDYARSVDADFCDFYSTSAYLNRFFLSAYWHSTVDDLDIQLPHLFHPVEMRDPATTSLIYWCRDSMVDMADFGRLYISKQDADFDRPVLSAKDY